MSFAQIEYDYAHEQMLKRDRDKAVEWARAVLSQSAQYCILDTETTGLDNPEIIQVSLVNFNSEVVYDSCVRPPRRGEITQVAFSKHGLSDSVLDKWPSWPAVYKDLCSAFGQCGADKLIAFNAQFDNRALLYSCKNAMIQQVLPTAECAMLPYSDFRGQWDFYRKSYRWQRLRGGDHSAKNDCIAVIKCIEEMAQ
jgi:DNA polymerase-3 subunit epsilon